MSAHYESTKSRHQNETTVRPDPAGTGRTVVRVASLCPTELHYRKGGVVFGGAIGSNVPLIDGGSVLAP